MRSGVIECKVMCDRVWRGVARCDAEVGGDDVAQQLPCAKGQVRLMTHDSPTAVARVSIPTTLPPALIGTHRKACRWCELCSSFQSAGRFRAWTAPAPEVQQNRDLAGCSNRCGV